MTSRSEQLLSKAYDLCEDGMFDEAIFCYNTVLKDEPNNVHALIDKAATLQNTGRTKKAIAVFEKALKIDPKNIDALLNKGAALHTLEKFDEAISCYDIIIKQNTRSAHAFAYKGLSLGERGDLKSALIHFKKALSIDGDYDLAKVSKIHAEQLLRDSDKKSKIL